MHTWLPLLFIFLLLSPGQDGMAAGPSKSGNTTSSPAVIYHNYCSVCHGDRGDGRSRARSSLNPPPRDFTTPAASRELTRETMITITTHGKPGTAMTGWRTQLTGQQIAEVTDYIRANFMRSTALSQHPGKPLYDKNCSSCHGVNGRAALQAQPGTKPPRDFGDPASAAILTRERMANAVRHGVPGTPMAAFGKQMRDQDIAAVVDYVRVAFMLPSASGISGTSAHGTAAIQAPATSASSARDLPFPGNLKGDQAQGRIFYNANCATCHGTSGNGQGPRARFITPKPRVFADPDARATLNRPKLFTAISHGRAGTDMPAWNKVLSDQEIANVAEYVFQQFIRTPSAAVVKSTN